MHVLAVFVPIGQRPSHRSSFRNRRNADGWSVLRSAQQPETIEKNTNKSSDIDDRSPLPPVGGKEAETKIALAERIKINADRAIIAGRKDLRGNPILGTGIVDFEEISGKKGSDENEAWCEVIRHAKSFSTRDLEEFAQRDLTRDDLLGYGPLPQAYRVKLLRFEGRITRVRRIAADPSLQDSGTKEVYEAELVAFDDPPNETMSVVFTELPPLLAELAQKPEEQWVEVNKDAVAAGYFFKVKQDRLIQPGKVPDKVPVLIGKSITFLTEQPPASAMGVNSRIPIDTSLQIFKAIKDDARVSRGEDNWREATAWNRVILHARRFSSEELEANARTDIKFADLFEDVRRDYKLQLVKFEGRLLMVRKMEPSQKMRGAGLDAAYEGWLVPRDEPRGNPICIVFTDKPEGLEFGRVNKWVSFAGYSFKLMRYESGERDKDDKNNVMKRAPMLIGRGIVFRPDPDGPSSLSWNNFVIVAVGVIVGLIGTALGITYAYRRGDKRASARSSTTARRTRSRARGDRIVVGQAFQPDSWPSMSGWKA